jgi:hypothetical protein
MSGAIYRYRRGQNWDPAAGRPAQSPARPKSARALEFGRLREQGLSVAQASRAIGVITTTGYQYEQDRNGGTS